MFDQVGVKVAFLPGVGIERGDAQRHDPFEVVVPVHVTGDRPSPESFLFKERDKAFDQGGLPGADRPEQVE